MRRWFVRGGLALLAALVLLLGYGVLIEPRLVLDEDRYAVELPRLPAESAGLEVALLADMQIGMWWANTGMVERAVERVLEDEPDLVLLGGDFVYHAGPDVEPEVEAAMDLLSPLLDSGIPTYAVLGNHDYASDAAEELTAALEGAGVPVLLNESEPVPGTGEDPLHVVGVGPVRPGLVDVDQALSGLPDDAPRVVLMHNPTAFPEMPPGSAPLTVAGHTHCGQIALPGLPRWSWLGLTEEEAVVADGWSAADYGAEGNALFVTCGLGFSVVPMRINAPPQVVFFELTPPD
ncbi:MULTISPECIES: metallophosphoesterase [unclassified Modestobacter]|uniref:metallophosphoesterase n=1 Tax=unclassified Modestobacter TaxID=2643866 RepID=UPI0022AAF17E|nr:MULTISPECIES: metallophosphoesterase [unclassified Modestobacter]MCZ2822832.1 metallophosphoesterase [Modestobacter sp. VKM Ac-2981]MCZ2851078.1 metallophosphoesterase [Modestobacter sp. VKM Ac-2982]